MSCLSLIVNSVSSYFVNNVTCFCCKRSGTRLCLGFCNPTHGLSHLYKNQGGIFHTATHTFIMYHTLNFFFLIKNLDKLEFKSSYNWYKFQDLINVYIYIYITYKKICLY